MNLIQQALISLINSKCSLPQGMTNPDDIASYLLQNGKITQDQYNQARVQMQNMCKNGGLPSPDEVIQMFMQKGLIPKNN